ncbi:MAG: co-chaperone GroES family protein [Bacteroidota bacterium]
MSDLILVGDRVLIEPAEPEQQTKAGLYLPASVAEKDNVQSGRVVRVGPGYLTANPDYSESEPWINREAVRYLPLQAELGDHAYFLRKEAIEMTYEGTTYLIVHHHAILALIRPTSGDVLDDLEGLEGLDQLFE